MQPTFPAEEFSASATEASSRELTRQAGEALDSAWEAFHKAALGGTIASPELQSRMESDLQRGRNLLRDAARALHHDDSDQVRSLATEIFSLSEQVKQDSHKEKR